jgi:AraC-like DNA-binding protein
MPASGKASWSPQGPSLGSVNCLLLARSRRHVVNDFAGPLSIKTVVEGKVAWKTQRRKIWVDDSSFLVLNDGEPYSMYIDDPDPVATRCVFFARGFVEQIAAGLSRAPDEQLGDPERQGDPLPFISCLYPQSAGMVRCLLSLAKRTSAGSPAIDVEESFQNIAYELLLHYKQIRMQMARIPAARAATRKELFVRIARGREFLHAAAYDSVSLSEAARAACMSPFHFQRVFSQAFGVSPARYVSALRFERAARLLSAGCPVTEVCLAVGFESLGSFSRGFRNYFGVSPRMLHPRFRKIGQAPEGGIRIQQLS